MIKKAKRDISYVLTLTILMVSFNFTIPVLTFGAVLDSSNMTALSLMPNSGFETYSGSIPTNWNLGWSTNGTVTNDSTVKHSGTYAVKFVGNGTDSNLGIYSNNLKVVPNRIYQYLLYTKTSGFTGSTYFTVAYKDASGNAIGSPVSSNIIGATNPEPSPIANINTLDWMPLSYEMVVPAGVDSVRIEIHANGLGTTWFDDINIEEKAVYNMISNGSAEQNLTDWRSDAGTNTIDATNKKDGTNSFKMVSTGSAVLTNTDRIPIIRHEKYFYSGYVKTSNLNGSAYIKFDFKDANGQTLQNTYDQTIGYSYDYFGIWNNGSAFAMYPLKSSKVTAATQDWTYISGYLSTPIFSIDNKLMTSTLNVSLVVEGSGTVWFDSLYLTKGSFNSARNPGAEYSSDVNVSNVDGFTASNTSTSEWTNEKAHSGSKSLKVTQANTYWNSNSISAKSGKIYRVSAYISDSSNQSDVNALFYTSTDGTGIAISGTTFSSSVGAVDADGFKYVYKEITAPAGANSLSLQLISTGSTLAYFDDMAIEGPIEASYDKTKHIDSSFTYAQSDLTAKASQITRADMAGQFGNELSYQYITNKINNVSYASQLSSMKTESLNQINNWYNAYDYDYGKDGPLGVARCTRSAIIEYDLIKYENCLSAYEEMVFKFKLSKLANFLTNEAIGEFGLSCAATEQANCVAYITQVIPDYTNVKQYYDFMKYWADYTLNASPDSYLPISSTGYTENSLGSMITLYKVLQKSNTYDFFNDARFKKILGNYMKLQTPSTDLNTQLKVGIPAIGDVGWGTSYSTFVCFAYEYKDTDPVFSSNLMYTWKKAGGLLDSGFTIDSKYRYFYTDTALTQVAPTLTSMKMSDVGLLLFRQGTGEYFLARDPSSRETSHEHNDAGGFSLFSGSTPLSLDPGILPYGDTRYPTRIGDKSSAAHNAVSFVDEANSNAQYDTDGKGTLASPIPTLFTSTNLDYSKMIIPTNGISSSRGQTSYNRHIAYFKNGINAYVVWDNIETSSTLASYNNIHTMSKTTDIVGNKATAHGYNNKDLEITYLQPETPTIVKGTNYPLSPSQFGLDANKLINPNSTNDIVEQEYFYVKAPAGGDHLTVLYPKTTGTTGITASKVALDNNVLKAYTLTNAAGQSVVVIVNKGTISQNVTVTSGSLIDMQTNTTYTGSITVQPQTMRMFTKSTTSTTFVSKTTITQNLVVSVINDTDATIDYTGGTWAYSTNRNAGDYNNDVHYTNVTGQYMQYTFEGTGIDLITPVSNGQSNMDIYIDGVFKTNVNTNGTGSYMPQQTVYSQKDLTFGTHTIKVVNKSSAWCQIDAFKVYKPINDTATNAILYSGTWGYSSNRSADDFYKDVHCATSTGAYAECTFYGTGVDVIMPKGPSQGNVDFYIDNVFKATVSTLGTTYTPKQTIYSIRSLTAGTHTVKMVRKTGKWMQLDAIASY